MPCLDKVSQHAVIVEKYVSMERISILLSQPKTVKKVDANGENAEEWNELIPVNQDLTETFEICKI